MPRKYPPLFPSETKDVEGSSDSEIDFIPLRKSKKSHSVGASDDETETSKGKIVFRVNKSPYPRRKNQPIEESEEDEQITLRKKSSSSSSSEEQKKSILKKVTSRKVTAKSSSSSSPEEKKFIPKKVTSRKVIAKSSSSSSSPEEKKSISKKITSSKDIKKSKPVKKKDLKSLPSKSGSKSSSSVSSEDKIFKISETKSTSDKQIKLRKHSSSSSSEEKCRKHHRRNCPCERESSSEEKCSKIITKHSTHSSSSSEEKCRKHGRKNCHCEKESSSEEKCSRHNKRNCPCEKESSSEEKCRKHNKRNCPCEKESLSDEKCHKHNKRNCPCEKESHQEDRRSRRHHEDEEDIIMCDIHTCNINLCKCDRRDERHDRNMCDVHRCDMSLCKCSPYPTNTCSTTISNIVRETIPPIVFTESSHPRKKITGKSSSSSSSSSRRRRGLCPKPKPNRSGTTEWTRRFENNSTVFVNTVDSHNGHVYVLGQYCGMLRISNDVVLQTTVLSDGTVQCDGFLAIYDQHNMLVFGANIWFYSGSRPISQYSQMDVDPEGNIYIITSFIGTLSVTDGPNTAVLQDTNGTIALIKYNQDGSLAYIIQFLGTIDDITHLKASADGNCYVCGNFTGTLRVGAAGNGSLTSTATKSMFISRIDPTGKPVWTRISSGKGIATALDVTVLSNGLITTMGSFNDTMTLQTNASSSPLIVTNTKARFTGWIAKIDSNGNWKSLISINFEEPRFCNPIPQGINLVPTSSLVATNQPESNYFLVRRLSTDNESNVYITGEFFGSFRLGTISVQTSLQTVYVAKLSPDGIWKWFRDMIINVPDNESYNPDIITDTNGNSYVGTFAHGDVIFRNHCSNPQLISESSGSLDYVVAKITDKGVWEWALSYPGMINIRSDVLATSTNTFIYVGGNHGVNNQRIDGFVSKVRS
jgi:hypothetical protein